MTFLAVVGVGSLIRSGGGPEGVEAREVIEDRVEVDDAPRVEIENFDGSIRVVRGDSGSVSYRVETSAGGIDEEDARRAVGLIRPVIQADPRTVRILVDHGNAPAGWSGRAEVRLEVPAEAQVRVVTRNGSVRVREIHGSVAAKSTNGRIEVEDARGPIVLETANGAIECEARDALVSAETSNGSIEFRGSLAPGTSRMVAGNGSISLQLPEDSRVEVDADSRNGRVVSDFPIRQDGGEVRAVLASSEDEPEARVLVRTSNGSIRVEKD
jgi:DUF4097 and DUF4098 domain-containing protein YvlB